VLAEAWEIGSTARFRGITSVIPTVSPPKPSLGVIDPTTAQGTTTSLWICLPRHELVAVGYCRMLRGLGRLGLRLFIGAEKRSIKRFRREFSTRSARGSF
jgi:hypothetical protein